VLPDKTLAVKAKDGSEFIFAKDELSPEVAVKDLGLTDSVSYRENRAYKIGAVERAFKNGSLEILSPDGSQIWAVLPEVGSEVSLAHFKLAPPVLYYNGRGYSLIQP